MGLDQQLHYHQVIPAASDPFTIKHLRLKFPCGDGRSNYICALELNLIELADPLSIIMVDMNAL